MVLAELRWWCRRIGGADERERERREKSAPVW